MNTAARLGLLGGTFDPIHVGHVAAARAARTRLGLDRVLLLPSNVPPHRPQPLVSVHHRFAMVALAVAGEDGLEASDLELSAPGPSYTAATLQRLHDRGYGASQLFFVIGADAFAEIDTWRDYPRFLEDAAFVVVNRGARSALDMPATVPSIASRMVPVSERRQVSHDVSRSVLLLDDGMPAVSSTDIRTRVNEGQSIAGLVPALVESHILKHRLYTGLLAHERSGAHHGTANLLHEQEHH
jgi:nicotinate-nucleotide adenylyltransferase